MKRKTGTVKGQRFAVCNQWSPDRDRLSFLPRQTHLRFIRFAFTCLVVLSLGSCSPPPVKVKDDKAFKSPDFQWKIP